MEPSTFPSSSSSATFSSATTKSNTYPYAPTFTPEMISNLNSQPHLSVEDGQRHIQFIIKARETILKNHRIHRQLVACCKGQQPQPQLDSCNNTDTQASGPVPAAPADPDSNTGSNSDCYLERELSNIFLLTRLIIRRVAECNDGFEIPYPHPPGPIRMRALLRDTVLGSLPVPTPITYNGVARVTDLKKNSGEETPAAETITPGQQPLLSSPTALSSPTSTPSRLLIPLPKVVIQPLEPAVAMTNASTITSKDATATTRSAPGIDTNGSTPSSNTNEHPVKIDTVNMSHTTKSPSKSTSKPTTTQKTLIQDDSFNIFVDSGKSSTISTQLIDETKYAVKGTCIISSDSGDAVIPVLTKPGTATPTTSTTPTPTESKIKIKKVAPARSKSPSPSKKLDQLVAVATVASSSRRLKRNALLDILPPPTVQAIQNSRVDSSNVAKIDAVVAGPGSMAGSVPSIIVKIKDFAPKAQASMASSTAVKDNATKPIKFSPHITTVKTSAVKNMVSDKSTMPAKVTSTTTGERPVAPSSGKPISRRLGRVMPTVLEAKVGSIFVAAISAVSKEVTNATSSSESSKFTFKTVKSQLSPSTASTAATTPLKAKAQVQPKDSSRDTSNSMAPETSSTETAVTNRKSSSEKTTVVTARMKKTFNDTFAPTSKSSSNSSDSVNTKPIKAATKINAATATITSKDKTTSASKSTKTLIISTSSKKKSTTHPTSTTANTKTASKDRTSRTRKSPIATPRTPLSPISPTHPTDTVDRHHRAPIVNTIIDEVSLSSPGSELRPLQSVDPFSHSASRSRNVSNLTSVHQQLKSHCQQLHATATNPSLSLPQQQKLIQQEQQQAIRSSPRPKRLLEVIHQDDHENNNLNDCSSLSSRHHYSGINSSNYNDSFYDESSPFLVHDNRPRKRVRLTKLNSTDTMPNNNAHVAVRVREVAGRNHGIYGQISFEQAVRAMSFKHPTTTSNTATMVTTMSASRRLYEFQRRRLAANGDRLRE